MGTSDHGNEYKYISLASARGVPAKCSGRALRCRRCALSATAAPVSSLKFRVFDSKFGVQSFGFRVLDVTWMRREGRASVGWEKKRARYLCVYIYIHTFIYIHAYIHIHIHTSIYLYPYLYIHISICLYSVYIYMQYI